MGTVTIGMRGDFCRWKRCCRGAGGLLLLAAWSAQAQAVDPAVEIRARANLLLTAAAGQPRQRLPARGNATQAATVSAVIGGQRSAASVTAQLRPGGTLPQGGVLRQAGDGVGISMNVSGLCDGAPAQTEGLYGEYGIELRNRSAREAYRVTLRIEYANEVAAEGPTREGEGAYAAALVTLADDRAERFSSSLTSDTALGDRIDVSPTGGSGQPLSDAGARTLDLDLPPGANLHLAGHQELRGAATTAGAAYHGALTVFVSLVVAVHIGNPSHNTVPVTQVPEKNGGIANLMLAAVCSLMFLAVIFVLLKRRK